jgi:hypothetical protein
VRRTVVRLVSVRVFVAAASASAAPLGFQSDCCSAQLVYTAAPGETNHLTAHGYVLNGSPYVTFSDPGNRIKPDLSHGDAAGSETLTSCLFLGDRATCPDMTNGWYIQLGDQDDSMRFDMSSDYTFQVADTVVFGGTGNDTLRGGNGPGGTVWLRGEAGADSLLGSYYDTMVGGPGPDSMAPLNPTPYLASTVDYSLSGGAPQTGVNVTLDGVANDGAPGEGDNVDPHVKTVLGTDGDDSLTGNTIGGHILWGLDGSNRLDSAGGSGELYGGDGDDEFVAADGAHQLVTCYGGADTVTADAQDNVASDCENVTRSP